MSTWLIKYENDEYPTVQAFGDYDNAKRLADRQNKYQENYTITEAPKPDLTIEKEQAAAEAKKYGCAL